jgi:hypothetical protein
VLLRVAVLQGGLKSFLDKLLADLNAGSSGQSFAAAVSTSTASSLVCINSIDYDPGSDPNTATPFVQVGSARYNRAGPGQIQAVVLNRSNLQPIANNSYADNSSGRSALSSYLSTLNSSQLVVVTGGKYFAYTADTTGAKHDPRQDRSVLAVHQSVAGRSDLFCHRRPRHGLWESRSKILGFASRSHSPFQLP